MILRKKAKVSFITAIAAFGFLAGGSVIPVKADTGNGEEWVDLNNDGLVDKDKLSPEERIKSDKRTAELDAYIEKMASKKAKLRAEKNKLKEPKNEKNITSIKKNVTTLEAELQSLEENMESNIGIVEVSSFPIGAAFEGSDFTVDDGTGYVDPANDVTPLASSSSDVNLTGTIYKDIWNAGRWMVKAEWEWVNSDWKDDRSGTGNVGKLDGFGLIVDEDTDIYTHTINTYWSYDGSKSTPGTIYNDKSEDDNGWGWKYQEKISWDQTSSGGSVETFSADYGYATMSVKFEDANTGNGDTVEATAKYGHTYNSTTISDITFSNSGISFTYNSTSGRWSDSENWPIVLR